MSLEGEYGQTEGEDEQAHHDQQRFAKTLDQTPDNAALERRRDQAGIREEIAHAMIFVAIIEFMAQQQGERGFEAGETKCCQKKHADQQSKLRLSQRVRPLGELGPESCRSGV